MVKADNLSWPIELRNDVFTFLRVLFALSFSQVVTGKVHAMRNKVYTLGK